MKGKSTLEYMFYLKRQEKKLAVRELLEADPGERKRIKRKAEEIRARYERVAAIGHTMKQNAALNN